MECAALDFKALLRLANMLADEMGVERVGRMELFEAWSDPVPQPVVKRRGGAWLWADRFYAAVCRPGGKIEYVYLTRTHIEEEIQGYAALRRRRPDAPALPEEIRRQFRSAMRRMHMRGTDIWLAEAYREAATFTRA